jgi:Acetyltransferase (GNAT) domain
VPKLSTSTLKWFDEPLQEFWSSRYSDWEKLATRYAHPEIVNATFVDAVVRTLARDQTTLRILTCLQDGRPVFMAIGQLVNFYTFSLFQPSQNPIALVLAKDGAALREFCQEYLRTKFLTVFRFVIYQADSKYYQCLDSTSTAEQFDHIQVPYVDFPERYEDYFLVLSKNFRGNCRKQRNKLEALGVNYRFDIVSAADEIEHALHLYSKLEVSGWKLSKGTAVDETTGQLDFYRTLLKSYAKSGQAHIAQLWIIENEVERLVASDLCIIHDKTAFMLKTAYDETLRDHETLSSLTPAALMHEELFKHWIEEYGLTRLEFYGKTLDWHLRWTEQQRPLYHLSIFRSKFAKAVFIQAKKLLK